MNIVCCALVVDNCDVTAKELEDLIKKQDPSPDGIEVIASYYPKQRIIKMQRLADLSWVAHTLRKLRLIELEELCKL